MTVADPLALLDAIEMQAADSPALGGAISRVAPTQSSFDFNSAADFQGKAKAIILALAPRLAGRSFHVRFHRRAAACHLPTPEVERDLDESLLAALRQAGTPGSIAFSDPDAVVAIDTVDNRAGLGLSSREDLACHHFLRPD